MGMKRVQLEAMRHSLEAKNPGLHTWHPHGSRNQIIAALWLAVDELASATGQRPGAISVRLQRKVQRQAGHLATLARVSPAASDD